ncbi:helix-turn-helix domain-containing protein [Cohnella thermotolerans]|uniref:helix-turn-helix domain-containing protein n=1 Tax=Cohnella thermotolerans TaxID=329858 RepID=UPI000412A3AF|nr:helix-turn-helix domain-containing protein [Cohnella thermotolerans]
MPKPSRLFRKFLLSYLAILIIPSLAGYMSYRTSISVTQSVSIENSITQLQKSQSLLERRMAEVEGFTRELALNPELNMLMNEKPSSQSNVYSIWSLMREVTAFTQTNDFLQNFFIYLNNYNVIITPGTTYYRPDHYFDTQHYTDLTLQQWEQKMLRSTHRSELMPLSAYVNKGTDTSVITYMQSLPLDSFTGSSPATVVVMIDESTVNSLLSSLQERYGGWVYVSDAEGRDIGSIGIDGPEIERLQSDVRFDKKKTSQFYGGDLVISIRSQKNGWVYMAGIPKQVLMKNANHIKHMTWTVTGAALLIGLLAGLVLSYRNSAPINRLLGIMREQFGSGAAAGRNEYDFLQGNISAMLTTNKRLENELIRQLPVVRDAFLKRLLAGELQSREEISAVASQANVALSENGYAAIILINGYSDMDSVQILNELSAARLLLKQELAGLNGSVLLTDLGSDRIAALIEVGNEDAQACANGEEVAQLLERLSTVAFEEYRITITAAIGEPFASIMEVPRSYEQALQTLEFAVYTNRKGIVRFSDTPTDSTTYYYPLESEQRLIGTVRAGDVEESKRIVQTIFDENAHNRALSIEMKHQLLAELQGTFMKLIDQKAFLKSDQFEKIKRRIAEIPRAETVEAARGEIHAIIAALCDIVTSRKNEMHTQTVEQIKRVIEEMYADPELTLYRIAEQVERPEKYISQLFKEVTGVNLSDYLEKVRLDHAAELLRRHTHTVDEISERVGYNSSHSFRRAFKRVMGVSPSSYRQSLQE